MVFLDPGCYSTTPFLFATHSSKPVLGAKQKEVEAGGVGDTSSGLTACLL